MRNERALAGTPSGRWPASYPAPTGRHPVYMFGVVPRGMSAICPNQTDEALIRIREEAGAALPDVHVHQRADVRAGDRHIFTFGVAAEQFPAVPLDEPVNCFWDVGTA